MPGGSPDALEQLAARLKAAAAGAAGLGTSTRQVTASIRSGAGWTGDAADGYSAFTGNLAQGAVAAEAPMSRIALAVQEYAGSLRTAQQKVAAYNSAAETAQVTGNDSGYMNAASLAGQDAAAAVSAQQAAGDRAAAEVRAAGGDLGNLLGSGPVRGWLDRQSVSWDTLAGLPGLGDPVGPQILKTPGAELGPEILKTPPGELGPLINYSEQGNENVSDVLKGKLGSITRAPLPRGSPSWSDIGNMTMNEVRAAARANQPGFKTILKLLTDSRFNKQ